MNNYTGTVNPQGVYVRALYDYEADDQTSLSFRQGDIIQVLTQLESGWWDGVIHGYRGWFPSNYCEAVDPSEAEQLELEHSDDDGFEESEAEEEALMANGTLNGATNGHVAPAQAATAGMNGGTSTQHSQQEEEAFWIPQATPDGRLFYFNTLTGISKVELPLQSPDQDGARGGRGSLRARDSSRPAPEMMAGGYETEDNTDLSESDAPKGRSRTSQVRRGILLRRAPLGVANLIE